MTRAKNLNGEARTDATRSSFEKKIERMEAVSLAWKRAKRRDDSFWPESLAQLADWEEPEKGIFRWSSPNVTTRDSKSFGGLVARYWDLQTNVLPKEVLSEREIEQKLLQQIATCRYQITEYRDAILRLDPNHPILNRLLFP